MSHFILTAAGADRKGLVAHVAEILFQAGCNLEDSSMTRLQGEFAMLVIFSAPAAFKAADLEHRLAAMKKDGLAVHVRPITEREARSPKSHGGRLMVILHGEDRPGIVYRATKLLAKSGLNITDLATHRTAAPGATSGYILYIEGEAPAGLTAAAMEEKLKAGLSDLDATVSVKPIDPLAL